jgi:NAD+ synthase
VYEIARELGVPQSIIVAKPTDGLFPDGRSDEDQIGATYPELEWVMEYIANRETYALNEREKQVMEIYRKRNQQNLHKINPIPVCLIPQELKTK